MHAIRKKVLLRPEMIAWLVRQLPPCPRSHVAALDCIRFFYGDTLDTPEEKMKAHMEEIIKAAFWWSGE